MFCLMIGGLCHTTDCGGVPPLRLRLRPQLGGVPMLNWTVGGDREAISVLIRPPVLDWEEPES